MSKSTVTILHNAVTAKLHEAPREVKLLVSTALSYTVAGHEHTIRFKAKQWDGKSSFLDFRQGTFPAGFVHLVTAHLRRAGYEVRVAAKPRPVPLGPEDPVVDAFPEDPRYDYQREVPRRLVKHGQIIAQVATGGGKSRIARLCIARINRPTLFLTTRSVLMYQMKRSIEADMKIGVSVLGDGQFGHTITSDSGIERQAVKKVSVGMVQTLAARLEVKDAQAEAEAIITSNLKKKIDWPLAKVKAEALARVERQARIREQTIRLLELFEFVILEEAHEASGDSYYEIMRHCKNAHYRLALTATPFMKDDEEANMRLHAVSGPVAIRITEKMLIDRGVLAKPYFKYVPLHTKPASLYKATPWQAAYRLGITDNDERNRLVVKEVLRASGYGLSSMVLVQHKKHGETLEAWLHSAGLRVAFIQGEDDQDERDRCLAALGKGEIDVLIGTNILDVGVDVPAVGMIILAGGGKAEVSLRQRVGRGLRAKKFGPNVAFIVDFMDAFNTNLIKHYLQRREIITGTPGFAEGVLAAGADFDYTSLGFKEAA